MPPVGSGPACVNGKDRRSNRASLRASARADAGPDPRARGAGAPPSPGSRSAHACGRPREARRRRPHFLSPNPPRPPRRPPPLGARAHRPAPQAGGRSRPVPALAPRPDGARFLLRPLLGVRDARPRAHGTRRSPHSPHRAPTSPGYDETWPRLPGKEGAEGSPVERRSECPAWSNRTRTPGRERGPVERGRPGRGSYREPPSRPPSPPGGPSRHRFLPGSASQLLPEEKPEPPLQLRRDQSVCPGPPAAGPPFRRLLTRTPHLGSSRRGDGSCSSPSRPAAAPASSRLVGFKLKFPGWAVSELRPPAPPPRGGSPSRAPGTKTPSSLARPRPRPGHALRPGHAPDPDPARAAPPAGFPGIGRLVPQLEGHPTPNAALDHDC